MALKQTVTDERCAPYTTSNESEPIRKGACPAPPSSLLSPQTEENIGNGQRYTEDIEPANPPDAKPSGNNGLEIEDGDSNDAHSLLFFYDSETTGLNINDEHITEIAAKVVTTTSVSQPVFSSLVYTERRIPDKVSELTGITNDLLQNEKPLSIVFPEFLEWISTTIREVSEDVGGHHYPVLVAHNGLRFDFPIMFKEIERHQLNLDSLQKHNIHFADTLIHLQQEKKKGFADLWDTKLSLKELYKKFLPAKSYSAHRALPDVEALEELFMETSLDKLLRTLPFILAKEKVEAWQIQKAKYNRC